MSGAAQPFRWTGSEMVPLRPRAADREYVVGEVYTLEPIEERSARSHAHYFACLAETWRNLPDDLAEEYASPEMLRKKALIRCGYRDERSIVCASKAEARRVAAFVAPMDGYAIVAVSEAVVRVWTAKSQSTKAMGKVEFQESSNKVLEFCADLLRCDAEDLSVRGEET